MGNVYMDNAKIFRAFCDETRLAVLELLRSGEKCACVLLEKVDVGQSTLSHHMGILVGSGVVSARKVGKWTYYSICDEGSNRAVRLLEELTAVTDCGNDDENARCCDCSDEGCC